MDSWIDSYEFETLKVPTLGELSDPMADDLLNLPDDQAEQLWADGKRVPWATTNTR